MFMARPSLSPRLRLILPADAPEAALPPSDVPVTRLSGQTMGTYWTVATIAPDVTCPLALRREIGGILDRILVSMSHWDKSSALSRYNQAAKGWVEVPADLCHVVATALAVAADSGGACDPAMGALVDLWGFGPPGPVAGPPDADTIAALLAGPRWTDVQVDEREGRMWQPGGVQLNLSAIAKGFAVDEVARYLRRQGVTSHLVDIGGELSGWGIKHDANPWWITLEQPMTLRGRVGGVPTRIALHGWAVATSGDSRRYVSGPGGRRLSHNIDPRTGYPVPHDVASVTVLHADCMMADALATVLTVLGPVEGLEWAADRGVMAIFAIRDKDDIREEVTPALVPLMELY